MSGGEIVLKKTHLYIPKLIRCYSYNFNVKATDLIIHL